MVRAVEGRALMGFPDTYRLPANEATAWHLIGNAVAPTVAADVINAIREAA
jgi:DNA (cytosine-5)-methyltransferase 1